MGTNFYIGKKNPIHIGKRSAAGLFCWDCNKTLCDDEKDIHKSSSSWAEKCPYCGKSPIKEGLKNSAVGVELGFSNAISGKKTGVSSCSSFSWAIKPDEFVTMKGIRIFDEYGKEYTRKEFKQVLLSCPIKYYDSVGDEFC